MKINKNLIWLLLLTLLVSGTVYGAVTITTPTVNTGELIRAGDWNKIRADLDSLNSALDIYGNQSWQSSGGNMYYLNGKVGIGVATPPAQLGVYKESPAANETMFQIGTGADDDKFTIDEDGDITADGTMLLRGGTLYDSSGGLELHGEDDVYVGIDWNNNDADNRSFVIGKNAAGPGTNWEEIMVVQEDGKVGIGTTTPSTKLNIFTQNVGGGRVTANANADELLIENNSNAGLTIGTANLGNIFVGNNTTSDLGKISYSTNNNSWRFSTNQSEKMRIDEDGKVGIGTTTPASELDVSGTIRAEAICDETGSNCQDISAGWAASGGGGSGISINDLNDGITDYTTRHSLFLGDNAGNETMSTTAERNVGIGRNALSALSSSCIHGSNECDSNTAVGFNAGGSVTTGKNNTLIGREAGRVITSGFGNSAFGTTALYHATGNDNTAVGDDALFRVTTGSSNVGIGHQALAGNNTGSDNIALGYGAGRYIIGSTTLNTGVNDSIYMGREVRASTTGNTNEIVIGHEAEGAGSNTITFGNDDVIKTLLKGNVGIGTTTPTYKLEVSGANSDASINGIRVGRGGGDKVENTVVGYNSLNNNTTGGHNTTIGYNVLRDNTTGSYNVATGNFSLRANTTGSYNTGNGYANLASNTTGSYNAASGYRALHFNTTGVNNTANGAFVLENNTTGDYNTAVGGNALNKNTTGLSNTTTGYGSLYNNTTGNYNTTSGFQSLFSNTTGSTNTANGYKSLYYNTTGANNTANGVYALLNNTTGNFNVATGRSSLLDNTTGSNNTANGSYALNRNTTGNYNTATGYAGLYYNTAGNHNTTSGHYSLSSNTTGNNNTAHGYLSLRYSTGDNNTSLGYTAGDNITTGSNNIIIGANTNAPSATASNQLNIGNWIYGSNGNVGIGTTAPTAKLSVAGTANKTGGGSWATFSDARLKDIQGNYTKGLNEITQLNPVEFSYKENNALEWDSEKTYQGLIAQEVQKTFPEAVTKSSNTYLELDTLSIDMAIINAIKELKAENEALKTRIGNLEKE